MEEVINDNVEDSPQEAYLRGFNDRVNGRDSIPPQGVDKWWWNNHYNHGQEDAREILDE